MEYREKNTRNKWGNNERAYYYDCHWCPRRSRDKQCGRSHLRRDTGQEFPQTNKTLSHRIKKLYEYEVRLIQGKPYLDKPLKTKC